MRPSQYSPLKRACVYIDAQRAVISGLRGEVEFHTGARAVQAELITKLHGDTVQLYAEIYRLRAPLWRRVLRVVRSWAP